MIDGLPETHSTRAFAARHPGRVFMNFFNEHQRGAADWNGKERMVQVNRTEALDASRAAVRDKHLDLPRRDRLVETFASHLASDAKVLDEDEQTGAKRFRYVKTGTKHFSLAFTYAWMATHITVISVRAAFGRAAGWDWRESDLGTSYGHGWPNENGEKTTGPPARRVPLSRETGVPAYRYGARPPVSRTVMGQFSAPWWRGCPDLPFGRIAASR